MLGEEAPAIPMDKDLAGQTEAISEETQAIPTEGGGQKAK